MSAALIIGGGLLGAALARQAAAAGRAVVVASRAPRPHPGLWVAFDLAADGPEGLLRAAGPGASVVVAVRGVDGPTVSRFVGRVRGARVVVAAPLGQTAGIGGAAVVEVGPLFGPDDRCIAPLLPRLREGRGASLPRGLGPCRPLYVEDAARAIWAHEERARDGRASDGRGIALVGPEVLDAGGIGAILAGRFGGAVGPGWLGGLSRAETEGLARSASAADGWDDAGLGPRRTVRDWIERLPGPRPRR